MALKARAELNLLLGGRSPAELEQLSEEEKGQLVRQIKLQTLMLDASAIFEMEVLLGLKSVEAAVAVQELAMVKTQLATLEHSGATRLPRKAFPRFGEMGACTAGLPERAQGSRVKHFPVHSPDYFNSISKGCVQPHLRISFK